MKLSEKSECADICMQAFSLNSSGHDRNEWHGTKSKVSEMSSYWNAKTGCIWM